MDAFQGTVILTERISSQLLMERFVFQENLCSLMFVCLIKVRVSICELNRLLIVTIYPFPTNKDKKMYFKKSIILTSFVILLVTIPPAISVASEVEFCYGPECPLPPEQWAEEFPDCSGGQQSPIDILGTERNKKLRPITFHYRPSEFFVKNNGHTTEVEYEEGSSNYINVGDEQCDLLQFHFHTRSEHGAGGGSFPMEAHLVHQCESGSLAVVGVMMHYLSETPNKALNQALTYAPFDKESGEYVTDTVHEAGRHVNANDLLPTRNRKYYTYRGSLTTPPCSEVVDWYVMKKPVGISQEQMETFKTILTDTSLDHYPFNNRPLQNLNKRVIERLTRHY